MNLITKLLIVLFFVVLAIKPTYFIMLHEELGIFTGYGPLAVVLIRKLSAPDTTSILTRGQFENATMIIHLLNQGVIGENDLNPETFLETIQKKLDEMQK